MANVFISYRRVDADDARKLGTAIQNAGHEVFLDEWRIEAGDSLVETISRGLGDARYLVLCCSGAGSSPWVDREWQSFLGRQLGGEDVKILPAVLPGGATPAILADIRYADLAADWDAGVSDLLRAIR